MYVRERNLWLLLVLVKVTLVSESFQRNAWRSSLTADNLRGLHKEGSIYNSTFLRETPQLHPT